MRNPPIITSYPLAVIARHYKLDYQRVLFVADYLRNKNVTDDARVAYNLTPLIVVGHINEVVTQLQMMQQGTLSWDNGHILYLE